MPSNLRDRLQALWIQNTRNRIVITVGTCVVVILLLCGCLNVMGSLFSGTIDSLAATGTLVRPTFPIGTAQAANINPTFPLPQPTTYPNPNTNGGTPAPSSGTPQPSPTASPTPLVTDTPTAGPGSRLSYTISPTDGVFTAGQTNQINLSGPPGLTVGVSIFFSGSTCLIGQAPNDPVILDATGHGTFSCDIPAPLSGQTAGLQLNPLGGHQINRNIPIV